MRRIAGPNPRRNTPARASFALWSVILFAAPFLGSCSHARAQPTEPGAQTPPPAGSPLAPLAALSPSPAWRELARLGERELAEPRDADPSIPLPPGLALERSDEESDPQREAMTLDEALRAVRSSEPATTPIPEAEEDPSERFEALREYVRGRSALLGGKSGEAIYLLERATEGDPGAPEPWRALAEAKLAQGRQREAMEDFSRAASLGLTDPRVHELLARDAVEGERFEEGARHLTRAMELEPGRADPALPRIVRFELAWSLERLGYVSAALEAANQWRRAAPPPGIPTAFTEHLRRLERLEPLLWRRLGDSALRLGDAQGALEAYDAARESAQDPGAALAPRIVTAALRAGRPAWAAMIALRPLLEAGPMLSRSRLRLIEYASEHSDLGELLGAALEEHSPELPATASIRTRIARARAACLSRHREDVLLRHISGHPFSSIAIRDLLEPAKDDPHRAFDLAVRALDPDGLNARQVVEELCSIGLGADALLGASEGRDDRSRLLRARIAMRFARVRAAGEILARASNRLAGLEVARVEAAFALGEMDEIDRAIERIRSRASSRRSLALGLALSAAQRFEEAGAAFVDHARANPGDASAASRAANVLLSRGELEEGGKWLDAAERLDPYDDAIRELQLGLWMPGGAMEDPERFEAGVRELRRRGSEGPLIRRLAAQQLLGQGLVVEAEERLLAYASDYPTDERVVDMLVEAWARQAKTGNTDALERGEAWLRARARERPASAEVPIELSRLIVESGRLSLAEAALVEAHARLPRRELGAAREELVGELMGEPERAMELAQARLAEAPPSLWNLLDLARLHARRGELDHAVATLDRLADGIQLRADQGASLLETVRQVASGASAGGVARAWRAIAIADRYGLSVGPEVHERLLTLMANEGTATKAEYLRAIGLTESQHPDLGTAAILRVASVLARRGARALALEVVRAWAASGERPEIDAGTAELWFILVSDAGDAEDARALLDAVGDPLARDLLTSLDRQAPTDAASARAELAYLLAGVAYRESREETASGFYRLALEYDPAHPGANNDLGYFIVESGGDLEEAERMLRTAVRTEPDNVNFLDSLGWLRYKLGRLEDEGGASGDPLRMGAVSLLERAARAGGREENATILDHLGDALWRAGRRDEAIVKWMRARVVLERELAAPGAPELPSVLLAEMRARQEALEEKLEAARKGLEPEITPTDAEAGGATPSDGKD